MLSYLIKNTAFNAICNYFSKKLTFILQTVVLPKLQYGKLDFYMIISADKIRETSSVAEGVNLRVTVMAGRVQQLLQLHQIWHWGGHFYTQIQILFCIMHFFHIQDDISRTIVS
jgi:hypothetical protein